MKLTVFNGCIDFGINLDDIRVKDDAIETKRSIIKHIVDRIDEGDDLNFIIRDLTTFLEPNLYEHNNCSQCGDYNEYAEYQID